MKSALRPLSLLATFTPVLILAYGLFLLGDKGLLMTLAVAVCPIFFYLLWRWPTEMLCLGIAALAVAPFDWGISRTPKIFLDEIILVGYGVLFLFTYLVLRKKTFRSGGIGLTFLFAAFLATHLATFFFRPLQMTPLRNIFETYVLGIAFFYIFYNETDRHNRERIVQALLWVTVGLSLLMLLEKATGYNPVLRTVTEFMYISPELAGQARGIYRPYINFFSPSEAGTFIAMGLPFVLLQWERKRSWFTLALVSLVVMALLVNYTRGVWFGVGAATLLFFRPIRRYLWLAAVGTATAVFLVFLGFHDHPAVQRLYDPTNLLNRFFYWSVAIDIIKSHLLWGIGHMNFKALYLQFITYVDPGISGFDIKSVFVADNAYLLTFVEHGLWAFLSLGSLCGYVLIQGHALSGRLNRGGDEAGRGILRACLMGFTIYALAGMLADVHLFTKATKFLFVILGVGWSVNKGEADEPSGIATRAV